ncbi:UNVERIFIED_CONTAM: zinc carboxypeptidase A 1 [Trichonephila clavipes]
MRLYKEPLKQVFLDSIKIFFSPEQIGSKLKLSKPAIWIDGGIHAREWISPATVTFHDFCYLVSEYDNNPEVKELVDSFDWYILPVVNPDGYVYSHSVIRVLFSPDI